MMREDVPATISWPATSGHDETPLILTELPLSSNEEELVMIAIGAAASALAITLNPPMTTMSARFRM
jgi:hypothetical protein